MGDWRPRLARLLGPLLRTFVGDDAVGWRGRAAFELRHDTLCSSVGGADADADGRFEFVVGPVYRPDATKRCLGLGRRWARVPVPWAWPSLGLCSGALGLAVVGPVSRPDTTKTSRALRD